MTTIVYRDGVLAADRRVSRNSVSIGHRRKIVAVLNPDGELLGWVVCWGWPSDTIEAAKWLSKWPEIEAAPKRLADGDAGGLFLLKSGGIWDLIGPETFQIEAEFHAVGSGFEIAMGALAMGASATKAVEIASAYDQGTGCGVDSVKVI